MHPILKLRQARHFEEFRCIGPQCEDTCCGDWGISIDRKTHEKYQVCSDPEMRPLLQEYVTISPSQANDEDYGRIALVNNRCPFLSEGLCSIQLKLGEENLSNNCSSYPRAIAVIDGVAERHLHLSCPEAARLILLKPGPYDWTEQPATDPDPTGKVRPESFPSFDSSKANRGGTAYPFFDEVRTLFLDVLRSEPHPTWERLAILARLSEEFNDILETRDPETEQPRETAAFLERNRAALQSGALRGCRVTQYPPSTQIETVLEIIVTRIGTDFATPRFLECYRDFMQGLLWGPETSIEELNARYQAAQERYYAPFMDRHGYLLNNFLIHYALRTVFPYRHREAAQRLQLDYVQNAVLRQYLVLAVHYALIRTVLIGMSALYGQNFSTGHVVKLVQGYAKAFLHSSSFPEASREVLRNQGIKTPREAVVLFQD